MNNEYETRLTSLEIKITYLEDFLTKLQQIAVEQGVMLDTIKTETKLIRGKLTELIDAQENDIPNVRPPHY